MSALAASPVRPLTLRQARIPAWWAGVFACVVGGLAMLQPALNADLGWHLRTGYWILASHAIPTSDPYSFTRAGAPWADHEWLWQAAMALVDRSWGAIGIVVAHGLFASVAGALVYRRLRVREVAPLFAAAGVALAMVSVVFVAEARPSLLVAPFAAAFLLGFEAYRRKPRRLSLLALLPLQVLWANTHGSYVVSFLLCGVYAAAAVWDARRLSAALPWSGLLAGLAAASAVNPLGLDLLRFTLFASRLSFNRQFIAEWEAPNFRAWGFAPLLLTIAFSLLLAASARRWQRDRCQVLLLAVCTAAVLYSQQFLLLYAVAAAPLLAEMLHDLAGRTGSAPLSAASGLGLAAAAVLFTMAFPVNHLQPAAYRAAVAGIYPVDAVDFIKRHELSGPMWNDFEWGGYLVDALPNVPVSVDGRTELYGDPFMHEYARVGLAFEPAQPVLDHYGVAFVLTRADMPLATELRQLPGWRETYHDELASVFERHAEAS